MASDEWKLILSERENIVCMELQTQSHQGFASGQAEFAVPNPEKWFEMQQKKSVLFNFKLYLKGLSVIGDKSGEREGHSSSQTPWNHTAVLVLLKQTQSLEEVIL